MAAGPTRRRTLFENAPPMSAFGCPMIDSVQFEFGGDGVFRNQALVFRLEQDGRATGGDREMPDHNALSGVEIDGRAKIDGEGRELFQHRRPSLGSVRLLAQSTGEKPGHAGREKQDTKREDILDMRDSHREQWLDEEEIVGEKRENGGGDPCPKSEPDGGDQYRDDKEQHQARRRQDPAHDVREQHRQADNGERQDQTRGAGPGAPSLPDRSVRLSAGMIDHAPCVGRRRPAVHHLYEILMPEPSNPYRNLMARGAGFSRLAGRSGRNWSFMDASTSTAPANAIPAHDATHQRKAGFWALTLGSIGVVYGDIGTSPLYAFREAMVAASGASGETLPAIHRSDVLGVLSLILWALTIIVTLKYVTILLRADNQREGGTLSLLALAQRAIGRSTSAILALGAIGAALFYGDALITPAISVLSAVEGLKLVTTRFEPYVVPITIGIIVALFLVQYRGTAAVAGWFGPITLAWFAVMAIGGVVQVGDDLSIFEAVNPVHAVGFVVNNGTIGLIALGAVFLAVTGAEALYADLGHFGRRPIQFAWLFVAFPALALNYLGQGALALRNPAALENPFFLLYPSWALVPVVVLATMATIIASQAVITGAYSLTRQAIQLKLLPRMRIQHTSEEQAGQVYMPGVNTLLLVGVLALVLAFSSSSKLATAYGIAVTGTMVATVLLASVVVRRYWRWPLWATVALIVPFLAIDLVFLGANFMKLPEGGYVPLAIAALVVLVMWTWIKGTALLAVKDRQAEISIADLLQMLEKRPPTVIPGTAVFLTSHPDFAPVALMHSLKHFKTLHERNVILTIVTADVPRVPDAERIRMEDINPQFSRVTMTFGYMEAPNVPHGLSLCRKLGWKFEIMSTSFLVSRRSLRLAARSAMPSWQSRLFMFLARNAIGATDYFHIPAGRVVEVGTQVSV
jgi:KUP system potassium uptake protein